MGKTKYRINGIKDVVNNPLYRQPRLPQPDTDALVSPILRQNSNADANTYLQSLPATMAFPYKMRGNINPEDIHETPYKNKVTTWYAEHPDSQLYGFVDKNLDRLSDAIPIKEDQSNYRRSYDIVTDQDIDNAYRYNRSLMSVSGIPHNVPYQQADVSTPVEAGKYIADYNRLSNAMSDWKETLQNSSYLDSFYDEANGDDNSYKLWSRDKDAKLMAQALADCNGDVEMAIEKIAKGYYNISDAAYNAVLNMAGYDIDIKKGRERDIDPKDVWRLKGQSFERFFNAHNAARDNYDIDASRPSSDAYYGYDQDAYNAYIRDRAVRDFKYRDGLKYARGGHLRTPKTIRSSNGIKMHRAEGLGGADYDIYF